MPNTKIKLKITIAQTIIAMAGLAVIIYYLRGLPFEVEDFVTIFFFSVCFCLAEFFDISLPQGGTHSVSSAIIIAAVLLFPLPVVVSIAMLGTLTAALISKKGLGIVLASSGENIISATLSALVFYLLGGKVHDVSLFKDIIPLFGLAVTFLIADISFEQVFLYLKKPMPFIGASIGVMQLLGPMYVALASTGILMALMYDSMKIWSIVLFFLPLLVTRHSFKLFLDIRETYNNTMKALATAIETQSSKRPGYTEKVADLSVDVARLMGIRGKDLEIINNAALLHDIGKIGVDEESLDSLLDTATGENEGEVLHASIGGDILEQVDYLKDCSDIVRKHHVSYKSEDKRSRASELIPLGARIINVADHYYELTYLREPEERLSSREAVARIKSERGLLFDPKVVRALMNALRFRGSLLMMINSGA